MSYRDNIAALEARVESLRREASAKVDELEHAQTLFDEARRRVRSHILDGEVATPCTAKWDDMKGDDRVRHCRACRKNVYNFAELTRNEIDALLAKWEGKVCARLFVRSDGTIKTKDCSSDVRLRSSRYALAIGGAALALGSAMTLASAIALGSADKPHDLVPTELEISGGYDLAPYDETVPSDVQAVINSTKL